MKLFATVFYLWVDKKWDKGRAVAVKRRGMRYYTASVACFLVEMQATVRRQTKLSADSFYDKLQMNAGLVAVVRHWYVSAFVRVYSWITQQQQNYLSHCTQASDCTWSVGDATDAGWNFRWKINNVREIFANFQKNMPWRFRWNSQQIGYISEKGVLSRCRVPLRPVIGRQGERGRIATPISKQISGAWAVSYL